MAQEVAVNAVVTVTIARSPVKENAMFVRLEMVLLLAIHAALVRPIAKYASMLVLENVKLVRMDFNLIPRLR
jgi:hypothetical protein